MAPPSCPRSIPDDVIDRLLGTTVPGVVAAYSSGRLPGDVADRASSTLDGDLGTVWSPGLGTQAGNWLEYNLAKPITFDHLIDGGGDRRQALGADDGDGQRRRPEPHGRPCRRWPTAPRPWATQTVTLSFPAAHRRPACGSPSTPCAVTDLDYYSNKPIALPIGIAELHHPRDGAHARPTRPRCRARAQRPADGGRVAVPVSITGTTAAADVARALAGAGVRPRRRRDHAGCGVPQLQTQPGVTPGVDVDIDSLVLDSAAGRGRHARGSSGLAPSPWSRARRRRSRGPRIGDVGPVVVHDATETVLDGARAEHQRRLARHHRRARTWVRRS